ncbi:MAG: epoxyqueuosine reductase QueH [Bacteroidaceae bacterium]|nr:epoxyqueuosine reductase QueH [Bacteroidaceae bacterium]
MNKRNYQKELDQLLVRLQEEGAITEETAPTLLLHSCCAPCSSYTLEYLSRYFRITVLYFNPNIMRKEEYEKRVAEQQRLIEEIRPPLTPPQGEDLMPLKGEDQNQSQGQSLSGLSFIAGRYEPREFVEAVRGLEQEPEGGARCRVCYRLRLEEAARMAKEGGFDFFCTTLSISPLKHADWLNEIGEELAEQYGVSWLPSDFKKKGGYKRSIELSKEHNLYRQNFCGCEYSRNNKN